MNIESFRRHCLEKPGVTEETPFGPDTLVFKVAGKMFALADLNNFESVNLKCDLMDGSVRDALVRDLLDHSYALVVASLPRKVQEQLQG